MGGAGWRVGHAWWVVTRQRPRGEGGDEGGGRPGAAVEPRHPTPWAPVRRPAMAKTTEGAPLGAAPPLPRRRVRPRKREATRQRREEGDAERRTRKKRREERDQVSNGDPSSI